MPLQKDLKMVIFDVDGVLTDGRLIYGDQGECYKQFHAHDGMGLKLLQKAGFHVAIMSGRDSLPLRIRLKELGIERFQLGVKDKVSALKEILVGLSITDDEIAYMGDDLIDYHMMRKVAYALAPHNAVDEIKNISHYVTQRSGGSGAVREAVDHILRLHDVSPLSLINVTEMQQ